jgi:hypothetical protein
MAPIAIIVRKWPHASSRCAFGRAPGQAANADLRESGSIEQDADVVMIIYREEYATFAGAAPSSCRPDSRLLG